MGPAPIRIVVRLSAAGGILGILFLPLVFWPGFEAWQARSETHSPAEGVGQSFVLERNHPAFVELPFSSTNLAGSAPAGLTARLTLVAPQATVVDRIPVRVDRDRSRLRIPLTGIHADAGSSVAMELHDPAGATWVWGVEYDGYASGGRTLGGEPVGGDLAFRVVYRRSLVEILTDGVHVANGSRGLVLAMTSLAAASGLLVAGALRRVPDLDGAALTSAGLGGGLMVIAVLGLGGVLVGLPASQGGITATALSLGVVGTALWLRPPKASRVFDAQALILCLVVLVVGLIRLAFAADIPLPPHIDAVQHYRLVTDLLDPARLSAGANGVQDLVTRYYHLGFHGLAAWVFSLSGDGSPFSLLVLGQVIQAAAIGAVYFPVYVATRDGRAGLAAVLAAGLGWPMPAYASNWAKYPALLGLAVLPVAAGVLLLALRGHDLRRPVLLGLAGLAALGATLIHTRLALVFVAFVVALEVGRRLDAFIDRRPIPVKAPAAFGLVVLALGAALELGTPVGLAAIRSTLSKVVEAQGGLSTLLLFALLPFALRRHRRGVLTLGAWIAAMLLLELLPPGRPYPFPLLDAPMVSMALYLPMSGLAALGVSGLASHTLQNPTMGGRPVPWQPATMLLAAGYIAWALVAQHPAPGECCLLAGPADVALAQAARARLPANVRILIPIVPRGNFGPTEVDGGAWFSTLSHRATWPAFADIDLGSPARHERLCLNGITHIYAGGTSLSFSRTQLDLVPNLYSPVLVLPGAALYHVEGCPESRVAGGT